MVCHSVKLSLKIVGIIVGNPAYKFCLSVCLYPINVKTEPIGPRGGVRVLKLI